MPVRYITGRKDETMKARIAAILITLATTLTGTTATAPVIEYTYNPEPIIYQTEELPESFYVWTCTALCINEDGDGMILTDSMYQVNPDYDYISFSGLDYIIPGDIVCTVELMDPRYDDGILTRDDTVINHLDEETMKALIAERESQRTR